MTSKRIFPFLLLSPIISTILILLFYLNVFSFWQEKLTDNLFLPKKASETIVIIAIDDESLLNIGQWPWDRSIHARLLEKLTSAKNPPKAIGFDVSFFEKSNSYADTLLKNQIVTTIVLSSELKDGKKLKSIFPSARHGITNTIIDHDGITRMINPKGSFACEIIRPLECFQEDWMRINFVGKPGSFKTFSYLDVLDSKIDLNEFGDKIVLVGATAFDLHDTQIVPTSLGAGMAGVEIHANAIQTLLDRSFLTKESRILTAITVIILLTALLIILDFMSIKKGFIVTFAVLIAFFVYSVISFDFGIIRNLIYPPLAIILAFVSSIIYKYLTESKAKKFLRTAFSHYVQPAVVEELINNPQGLKLGGEKRRITILFTDIQGFTAISEKLKPQILTNQLNKYLTFLTEIIFNNKGVVDKFIGDSVMAFWGAPVPDRNQALNACTSALEIKKVSVGEFKTRIGINTGTAIVGNMGSVDRFDYTALGDSVNIASRLESLNKIYETQILISESTYKLVKMKVKAKLIDTVTLRGKTKPIKVYELLEVISVKD